MWQEALEFRFTQATGEREARVAAAAVVRRAGSSGVRLGDGCAGACAAGCRLYRSKAANFSSGGGGSAACG